MRLVQVTIPAGKRDAVIDALEDEGIDYVVTEEVGNREYTAIVTFPLPRNAVEPVLDGLKDEVGLSEESFMVVLDAETIVSRKFEKLQSEYETADVEEDRISRQELLSEAAELTPTFPIYVTMTVISAIVATAGLLLDSPAVVVGSMVIAPLIGPALAASVGTVVNDTDLFVSGVKYQALGVGLAIVSAAIFAFVVRMVPLVPPGLDIAAIDEVSERLAPDLLSLAVALGAGVAGVLSLSTGISVALVGVMIAAALIPPAAAAGIAFAWGMPEAALGSTVLVLVNVLSVNLAGLLTLWYTGYRPSEPLFDTPAARKAMYRNVAVLAAAVIVLSGFLGGMTYTSYQQAVFEDRATEEIEAMLDSPEYADLELLDVEIMLDENRPFQQPERIVVTLGRPVDTTHSGVAEAIQNRVADNTGTEVDVQVRFVDTETMS